MAITVKTTYALRALSEIAESEYNKPISRKEISKKQKISISFLERVLIKLQKAGIIKSIRGPGGGFILHKSKEKITVLDVVNAVEKSSYIYEKCETNNRENCEHVSSCNIKFVWEDINNTLEEKMLSITLEEIMKK